MILALYASVSKPVVLLVKLLDYDVCLSESEHCIVHSECTYVNTLALSHTNIAQRHAHT